jgi:hypothetical protein
LEKIEIARENWRKIEMARERKEEEQHAAAENDIRADK